MSSLTLRNTEKLIVFLPYPYEPEEVWFRNKALEAWMRNHGIKIPHAERVNFAGKKVVLLDDPEFGKAFREIYAATHYPLEKYQWWQKKLCRSIEL